LGTVWMDSSGNWNFQQIPITYAGGTCSLGPTTTTPPPTITPGQPPCSAVTCVPSPSQPIPGSLTIFYTGKVSASQLLPNINWPNVTLAPYASFFILAAGLAGAVHLTRSSQAQSPFSTTHRSPINLGKSKRIKLAR